MTPEHYIINKQYKLKVEDVINNFAGGLNIWQGNVLKYCNRALLKHKYPIDCLKSALNCVKKQENLETDDSKQPNYKKVCNASRIKNFTISNLMEDEATYNKIEDAEYRQFLVEIYKWVIGIYTNNYIEQAIQKQIDKYIKQDI